MTINAELLSLKNDIAAALADGFPEAFASDLLRDIRKLRGTLNHASWAAYDASPMPTAEEMEDFYGPDPSALVGCDNR